MTEAWRAKGKKEPSVRDNEDTEEMLNIHVMRACEVREREREWCRSGILRNSDQPFSKTDGGYQATDTKPAMNLKWVKCKENQNEGDTWQCGLRFLCTFLSSDGLRRVEQRSGNPLVRTDFVGMKFTFLPPTSHDSTGSPDFIS